MGKNIKILVSCTEANHLCDKTQYRESSLIEKIKLNIHLIYCRVCRKYTVNNSKLTKLMKNPKVMSLSQSSKEKMKEMLKQKMSEQ